MARFTHDNMPLLWLVLVTLCLFFGLDALPVAENDMSETTIIKTSIETDTYNSTEIDECNDYEFRCDDGECIGRGLVCDEEIHCRDASDENRQMCKERICYPRAPFKCIISGQCIKSSWVCDGDRDCLYGEDEDFEKCRPNTPPTLSSADKMFNAENEQMLYRNIESQQPEPVPRRPPNYPPPSYPGSTIPPFDPYRRDEPERRKYH